MEHFHKDFSLIITLLSGFDLILSWQWVRKDISLDVSLGSIKVLSTGGLISVFQDLLLAGHLQLELLVLKLVLVDNASQVVALVNELLLVVNPIAIFFIVSSEQCCILS